MKSILIIAAVVGCSFANAQILPTSLTKQEVNINQRLVSNKEWAEFLTFISKDPSFSKEYIQSVTPLGWSSKSMIKNGDSAVTGVSWLQANEYCKWKSEVNTYLYSHSSCVTYSKMLEENRLSKTRVTYRLPTGAESDSVAGTSKNSENGIGFRCVYMIEKVG